MGVTVVAPSSPPIVCQRREKILGHVTLLTLALISPITGHSWSELNDWLADYDQRYETAWINQEDLTSLDVELADMLARHPSWDGTLQDPPPPPVPVAHAPAGSSSAPGRGMGTGVEQWRSLVAAYFPADQVDMALRVMACESGGNPNAANPRSTARGLMQVMWSTWGPEYGVSEQDLYDPATNLNIAAKVWAIQGWNAWTCWRR